MQFAKIESTSVILFPRPDLAYAESDEDDKPLETQRKLDR